MNQETQGGDLSEKGCWPYGISPAHSWEYSAGDEGKNLDQNLEKPKPYERETSQQHGVSHKQRSPANRSQPRVPDRLHPQSDCILDLDLIETIQRPQQTEREGVSLAMPEGRGNSKTAEIGSPVGIGPDFCGIVEQSPWQIDGVSWEQKWTEVEIQGQ